MFVKCPLEIWPRLRIKLSANNHGCLVAAPNQLRRQQRPCIHPSIGLTVHFDVVALVGDHAQNFDGQNVIKTTGNLEPSSIIRIPLAAQPLP